MSIQISSVNLLISHTIDIKKQVKIIDFYVYLQLNTQMKTQIYRSLIKLFVKC